MEVGNLWLIPVSIFLNSSLYWLQKHYLIKWFCRKFLSNSVQLECDLELEQEVVANGVVNGQLTNEQLPSKKLKKKKKLVTDGEVNGIAME